MNGDTPLTNASEAELAAAVEENIYALNRILVQALGGELEEDEQLSRYFTWPSSPIFKGVFHTRLKGEEAEAVIEETITWFKRRQAPYFFWWTGEQTRPADLGERLEAHGLTVFGEADPCMAADIEQLNWDNPRPMGLRVEPVVSENQLLQWKRVFIESFAIPEFAGQAWVDATQAVGIGKTPWILLLGRLEGEAVCGGLLVCAAGVAGLVGLGTLPAFRRQGIGSAMQIERLRIARELGYRYAVLFASKMGYSPYLKLGFRDMGLRVSRYLWVAS
jgi:GNAT superfamily N-acetyltransferase